MAELTYTALDFADLKGWQDDDHAAALAVFRNTCGDLSDSNWASVCQSANASPDPMTYFEQTFRPVLIQDGQDMLFTGYYEPELDGRLTPDPTHRFPVHALPPELQHSLPWLTRQQIDQTAALSARGLEIAWLNDPLDVFFLQVQGSGRIRLPGGQTLRVGYAGKTGHPYRSIGAELVARGQINARQLSVQSIRDWTLAHPDQTQNLLWSNPSYVFFKVIEVPATQGPLGAMNRSVTALRSIAIDPQVVPLGAPVWVEKSGAAPLRRLMVAQDTGSAIQGAHRADIFYGTGQNAGQAAGMIRDPGRMVVLLPHDLAETLCANAPTRPQR